MSTQPGLTAAAASPRVPAVRFDFHAFRRADAVRITGATIDFQSDLVRRGRLNFNGGPPRYDLFGLSFLLAANVLADRRYVGLVQNAAKLAAWAIGWQALKWVDCYAGDHKRTLSWDAETFARIEAGEAATALLHDPSLTRAEGLAEVARLDLPHEGNWAMQASWLRHEIFRQRQYTHEPQRFVCWWADDTCDWHPTLDAAFNSGPSWDARFRGAVVTLDCDALADQIISLADRPFVRVEIEPDDETTESTTT